MSKRAQNTREFKAAARHYRHLIALQATLSPERAWELGGEIRAAKLCAYVELEAANATIGGL